MSAGCFYCDRVLRDLWDGIGPTPDDLATRDHVFPRSMLPTMGELSERWRYLNRVRCCYRCNQDKGVMHPLDWLATLAPSGRDRLRARLDKLGGWGGRRMEGGELHLEPRPDAHVATMGVDG